MRASRWVLAATAILFSGCAGSPGEAVLASAELPAKSVWEERLDLDYFDLRPFEEFRLENGGERTTRSVVLPADMEYVAVGVAFYSPNGDFSPLIRGSAFPSASGEWADGAIAFEFRRNGCCQTNTAVPPGAPVFDEAFQILLEIPPGDRTLTLIADGGEEGQFVDVAVEYATPMPLVGEPPYVTALDVDYFDRFDVERFRLDFPTAPGIGGADSARPFLVDYPFTLFQLEFFGTDASSAWLSAAAVPESWPAVHFSWDVPARAVGAEAEFWGGFPPTAHSVGTVEVLVRTPENATELRAHLQGWGVDQYAEVALFGAMPVDPRVEPDGEGYGGRTSRS